MNITLKDGSVLNVQDGATALDAARQISEGLARAALSCEINGEVHDLTTPLHEGDKLSILTFNDEMGRWTLRHTAAHIMAQAVQHLYPDARFAIGPAIENGFYYDFDREESFTPEDLEKIEAEMKRIIKENLPLKRFVLSKEEALKKMAGEPYKVELIENLPEGEEISFYSQGDFCDLCAGPHLPSTGGVKAIKLTSVTGAYWRGDSSRKMLQRIYGTAFTKKSDLDEYLHMLEEAKKRDHRKLGRELDLFMFADEGPGFPFFLPKGMVLRNLLEDFWRKEHKRAGYEEIRTPMILNEELWHRSGHWDHYKENMYFTRIDDEDYAIKPMNCPGGMLAYKRRMWSYRDLPIRSAEMGVVHRHELSGALHGMMRVRCFTQDDAHLYMTPEQIPQEIEGVIDLVDRIYKVFNFPYRVELSTRPDDFMGEIEQWDTATEALRQALERKGVEYRVNEGDGAFYGPKIDFHLIDSIGRTWQCATLQLDFQMPERFELEYTGPDGEKHRPVMIHRTVLGSMERFIGILTEHYAGAFPLWLSPVQVKVLPITDRTLPYACEVMAKLDEAGFRCELDERNEKIGYKIREAQMEKVPYMLVLGDKEQDAGLVAVRSRKTGETETMTLDALMEKLQREVDEKAQ
ncbi:MAG TPA: threonine--tRNA ligase [Candidatus Ventrousia excrementavium]|uniref:Threonine--tRNA ligase n=1 Tax=Candidatus Ventrousia excrementavium TaxID=2840961 RepID=A0A9D1LMD6_9CLOT|nr:threonine--tRNA ligase [Candidatus Ventrousia excrementavium]